jgi:hypothetical protein
MIASSTYAGSETSSMTEYIAMLRANAAIIAKEKYFTDQKISFFLIRKL